MALDSKSAQLGSRLTQQALLRLKAMAFVTCNLCRGGSNRLTRSHVWGGPLPPAKPGEEREMLKDSVNFWIDGGSSTILRDCYADTGKIGFLVDGWDTRLLGCSYFNNSVFKLDGITIVRHKRGRLLVTDGVFVKTTPHCTVYDGCGEVEWFNMMYSGFGPGEDCPGALTFKKRSAADQPALKLANNLRGDKPSFAGILDCIGKLRRRFTRFKYLA